mmetsp:Transcript_11177/g.29425  ORF Transcript_11177/g.29425 Transcript_11177/m.29425 type:complete len:205 (+) Transcript_11177:4182-4796(+)
MVLVVGLCLLHFERVGVLFGGSLCLHGLVGVLHAVGAQLASVVVKEGELGSVARMAVRLELVHHVGDESVFSLQILSFHIFLADSRVSGSTVGLCMNVFGGHTLHESTVASDEITLIGDARLGGHSVVGVFFPLILVVGVFRQGLIQGVSRSFAVCLRKLVLATSDETGVARHVVGRFCCDNHRVLRWLRLLKQAQSQTRKRSS